MVWSKHNYQFDAMGNTRALLDTSTDTVTDTFTYDAWGNEVEHTGSTKENFTWNGRIGYYHDRDMDTYQVRRRPYSPKRGRWLTVDPIWPADGINAFLYVLNSSINSIDPSGLAGKYGPCARECGRSPTACKSCCQLHPYADACGPSQKTILLTRLKSLQLKHSQYLYYRSSNIDSLYDEAIWTLRYHVTAVYGDAQLFMPGKVADYNPYFDNINYVQSINSVPEGVMMHEIVHAMDDYNDFYITPLFFGLLGSESEGLAYGVQFLVESTQSLQHFENITSPGFSQCNTVQANWVGTWNLINSLVPLNRVVWPLSSRSLSNSDLKDAYRKFGLRLSCTQLLEDYQRFVDGTIGCGCQLECPPNLLQMLQ